MADVNEKIGFLEKYRMHPEKYLPLADHAWKQFEKVDYGEEWYDDPWYNLGWDAGLLDETGRTSCCAGQPAGSRC